MSENQRKVSNKIIGIDLGTTNSCASVVEGGTFRIIEPIATSNKLTVPSVVALDENGVTIVGEAALRRAIINENVIQSIKRKIGKKGKENETIMLGDKKMTPIEVSSIILRHIKEYVEAKLGETVNEAVITVPAAFNDLQRDATKQAAEIAGFKNMEGKIINEPTAAALAYGLNKSEKDHKVLVYDLGGGTFDISVLEISKNIQKVEGTYGDTELGGDDFDQAIIDWLIADFEKMHGKGILSSDKLAEKRLKEAARIAKEDLASSNQTEINLPFLVVKKDGKALSFNKSLTLQQFNNLTEHLIKRTEDKLDETLNDLKLSPSDIDQVLLVGGSTRMRSVKDLIRRKLKKEPNISINPDTVVAAGAAVYGAMISKDITDVVLLDVVSLSIGIETAGIMGESGQMTKLIERNRTIPCDASKIFTTFQDNQTQVSINVLQGERELAKDNISLGTFVLSGIEPAPRGVPQIEVKINVTVDGIVSVSAKDLKTNKENKIEIKGRLKNLSDEEIKRIIEDAEKNKEKDKQEKEKIELVNKAQGYVWEIDKSLAKLKEEEKKEEQVKQVEKIRDEINQLIEKKDYDTLKTKMESLENAFRTATEMMYKAKAEEEKAKTSSDKKEENENQDKKNDEENQDKDDKEKDKK
jgi:molecular chaperone DnaK